MKKSPIDTIRVLAPHGTGAVSVSKIGALVGAGLLGLFIVLGVGFAPMAAVHNAVHDVRHSVAFPCH